MDTSKIKAVLLAAKYSSLSKAAETFSYTPSALSHSVDALENELGVKLLVRSHTGVKLSEEGKQLCDKLEAVIDAENALVMCARDLSARKQNQLRIGTYSSISVNLLPELLNGFKEKYPYVGISITVGNRLNDWLDKDIVDVVIGVENHEHEWFHITNDDFVAVVPEAQFAGKTTVCHEDLYPLPFIITENSTATQRLDLTRFKEIIRLRSDDDMAAVSMVRERMGVTILPSLVLKKCPAGVRVLELEPQLYRSLGICYKKGLSPSSGAMRFVHYLMSLY